MLGISLDGVDEVGDEVSAALILGLHVRPFVGHALVHVYERVISADCPKDDNDNDADEYHRALAE